MYEIKIETVDKVHRAILVLRFPWEKIGRYQDALQDHDLTDLLDKVKLWNKYLEKNKTNI